MRNVDLDKGGTFRQLLELQVGGYKDFEPGTVSQSFKIHFYNHYKTKLQHSLKKYSFVKGTKADNFGMPKEVLRCIRVF